MLVCSASDTSGWTLVSAARIPCSSGPTPALCVPPSPRSGGPRPRTACTPEMHGAVSGWEGLTEGGRRSENARYLVGLGESTGVARGARVPQPHVHVPAARYHDVDLGAILHTAYRSIVSPYDRTCRAGHTRTRLFVRTFLLLAKFKIFVNISELLSCCCIMPMTKANIGTHWFLNDSSITGVTPYKPLNSQTP